MFDHPSRHIWDLIVTIGLTILVLIVANLIIRHYLAQVVRHAVKKNHKNISPADEHKREQTLQRILKTTVTIFIWVIGVIIILSEIGVNWAALLSGAGVLGLVAGFGGQSLIKDILRGFFVIGEDQYRIGDIVGVAQPGGPIGLVEDLSVRITKLRDLDGNLHIVANGDIGIITNLSSKYGNANVDINVPYATDVDQARKIINDVGLKLAGENDWKSLTLEPIQFYRVDSFNDYSMTLKCIGKIVPPNQWNYSAAFRERLKKAFEKAGIELAIPQIIVRSETGK